MIISEHIEVRNAWYSAGGGYPHGQTTQPRGHRRRDQGNPHLRGYTSDEERPEEYPFKLDVPPAPGFQWRLTRLDLDTACPSFGEKWGRQADGVRLEDRCTG